MTVLNLGGAGETGQRPCPTLARAVRSLPKEPPSGYNPDAGAPAILGLHSGACRHAVVGPRGLVLRPRPLAERPFREARFMISALVLALQVAAPPDTGSAELRHRNGRIPRAITAAPATTPPKLDGRLDDPIWATAEAQQGFRRDVPSDGKPATDDVEIRVLYDQDALYVGARLLDSRPALVSRRLNRRDSFNNFNDVFFVLIDSYHDHRTQFIFGVDPGGRAARRDRHRGRHRRVRHRLGPGVGGAYQHRLAGLGGRDANPVLAAPLLAGAGADLGDPVPARQRPGRRGGGLAVVAPDRAGPGFQVRSSGRPPERAGSAATRGPALRREPGHPHRGRAAGQPVRRREQGLDHRRGRREIRAHQRPHLERHHQPRLRAGRSRSVGGESDGVRDLLRASGARSSSRARICSSTAAGPTPISIPAGSGGRRRSRSSARRRTSTNRRRLDPGRGQALRAHRLGLVDRRARRGDRPGGRPAGGRGRRADPPNPGRAA